MFNTTGKSPAEVAAEVEASVLELCDNPKTIRELHVAIGGSYSMVEAATLGLEGAGELSRITANPNGHGNNVTDQFKTTES